MFKGKGSHPWKKMHIIRHSGLVPISKPNLFFEEIETFITGGCGVSQIKIILILNVQGFWITSIS